MGVHISSVKQYTSDSIYDLPHLHKITQMYTCSPIIDDMHCTYFICVWMAHGVPKIRFSRYKWSLSLITWKEDEERNELSDLKNEIRGGKRRKVAQTRYDKISLDKINKNKIMSIENRDRNSKNDVNWEWDG